MPVNITVRAALAVVILACLAPNRAFATDAYPPTGQEIPIDLSDDTGVLTAHASIPDPRGGPVDDACRAAASAGNKGDTGTIVVCSHGGDGNSQRVPPSKSVDESTRTGVPRAPDFSPPSSCMGPCITIPFGRAPPPVYYIDLSSIPEAPKGSDAWKIGRGELRAP
ncbi:hypothetical protein [Novosphingobium gossypii]|uniref:hypothetical protein n=1 Tax=Novosphingobium gossypii TaxID=1604774 RepID=UPI003D195667